MSPYAESQMAPLQSGVRSLAQAMAMGPRIRAQAANMTAQQQQREAMTGEAQARAGLYNTQNQRGQLQLSQALALADRFKQPGAITQDGQGNIIIDKGAVADVTSALSGMGKDANDSSSALANIFKSVNAPNQANLERTNKASIAAGANAERAARPVVVPTGGTLVAPGGQPLAAGGYTLNQGQSRFAPQGLAAALAQGGQGGQGTDYSPGDDMPGQPQQPAGPAAPIASVPPKASAPPKTSPALPPSVQAQVFKALLEGGTNTQTALTGLQKAVASAGTPAAALPAAASSVPTINSQADYNQLPPGTAYKDSTGRTAVKRK